MARDANAPQIVQAKAHKVKRRVKAASALKRNKETCATECGGPASSEQLVASGLLTSGASGPMGSAFIMELYVSISARRHRFCPG